MDDYREFEATSAVTGETYQVQFRWLQTAISLRHSDTVDVKFLVNGEGKIIAIPHAALEQFCAKAGIPLQDKFCARLAGRYLEDVLVTGRDAELSLLTMTAPRVEEMGNLELSTAPRR